MFLDISEAYSTQTEREKKINCPPAKDSSLSLRQYKIIVCCEYFTK